MVDAFGIFGLTGFAMACIVLDADEAWALVLADEGKKKEREMLLRLDSVKNIKVK